MRTATLNRVATFPSFLQRAGARLVVIASVLLLMSVAFVHQRPALAQTPPAVTVTQNATLGGIFTDSNGMTLYVFARDSAGVSNCNGGCATVWPALQPPAGDLVLPDGVAGTLATITRQDGTQQVTYNGMPLYYYSGDTNPGDTNGQGIGGVWMAAMPQAS